MSFVHSFQILSKSHLSRRQALLGLSLLALSACSRVPKPSTANTGSYYTCTMHPFVHSQTPGKCPVCGMDLLLVTNTSTKNPAAIGMVTISQERLDEIGARTEAVKRIASLHGNEGLLIVPASAVLPTGNTYLAFVDHGGGQIEPREIKVTALSGDSYEVLSGLNEGDHVFVSANFLIDAESRIQGVLKTWGDRP
jgi:hypothetical protein